MNLVSPWTRLATLILAVVASAHFSPAHAGYPEKPIRLVVGFPPGQATDVIARMLAKVLQDALGQPVVVENRPGAGGINGTTEVVRSAPDGYTLLVTSSGPLAVNPSLYARLPYKPEKDLEPISTLAALPLYLAVNPAFPAQTFGEFVRHVKSQPGKIDYASAGNGVTSHLAMELLKNQLQMFLVHVPYRGSGPALNDVIGGQVPVILDTGPAILPSGAAGKIRVLAVTTQQRSALTPDIPSIAELTKTSFDVSAWVGLVAPKGTPAQVIDTLHKAVQSNWNKPDIKRQLGSLGGETQTMAPAAFQAYIASETKKFAKAVALSGAKAD